jgi:hypothetical protein
MSRAYETGVQQVHRTGARRANNGACESMKGPIAVAIDVLLAFLLLLWGYFQLFIVNLGK